jgi:hypothetical protein
MLTAEARIETERPSRYLVQLCRHANQMGKSLRHRPRAHDGGGTPPEVRHVEWSDTYGIVTSNLGQWTMRATSDSLTLRAEADNEECLRRIQTLLTQRLEGFGRRDRLKVEWQAPIGQPGSVTQAATAKVPARRSHRGTTVLIAAVALAVALHLGLGSAMLSAQWTGWTADAILAVVLLKVIAVGVIGLRRRATRRKKASTASDDH